MIAAVYEYSSGQMVLNPVPLINYALTDVIYGSYDGTIWDLENYGSNRGSKYYEYNNYHINNTYYDKSTPITS